MILSPSSSSPASVSPPQGGSSTNTSQKSKTKRDKKEKREKKASSSIFAKEPESFVPPALDGQQGLPLHSLAITAWTSYHQHRSHRDSQGPRRSDPSVSLGPSSSGGSGEYGDEEEKLRDRDREMTWQAMEGTLMTAMYLVKKLTYHHHRRLSNINNKHVANNLISFSSFLNNNNAKHDLNTFQYLARLSPTLSTQLTRALLQSVGDVGSDNQSQSSAVNVSPAVLKNKETNGKRTFDVYVKRATTRATKVTTTCWDSAWAPEIPCG